MSSLRLTHELLRTFQLKNVWSKLDEIGFDSQVGLVPSPIATAAELFETHHRTLIG